MDRNSRESLMPGVRKTESQGPGAGERVGRVTTTILKLQTL